MIKDIIKNLTDQAISAYGFQSDTNSKSIYNVERPTNPEFGDFSTNVAMVYAKSEKKSPMAIAERLLDFFPENKKIINEIKIAKPGFINFYLYFLVSFKFYFILIIFFKFSSACRR